MTDKPLLGAITERVPHTKSNKINILCTVLFVRKRHPVRKQMGVTTIIIVVSSLVDHGKPLNQVALSFGHARQRIRRIKPIKRFIVRLFKSNISTDS